MATEVRNRRLDELQFVLKKGFKELEAIVKENPEIEGLEEFFRGRKEDYDQFIKAVGEYTIDKPVCVISGYLKRDGYAPKISGGICFNPETYFKLNHDLQRKLDEEKKRRTEIKFEIEFEEDIPEVSSDYAIIDEVD